MENSKNGSAANDEKVRTHCKTQDIKINISREKVDAMLFFARLTDQITVRSIDSNTWLRSYLAPEFIRASLKFVSFTLRETTTCDVCLQPK